MPGRCRRRRRREDVDPRFLCLPFLFRQFRALVESLGMGVGVTDEIDPCIVSANLQNARTQSGPRSHGLDLRHRNGSNKFVQSHTKLSKSSMSDTSSSKIDGHLAHGMSRDAFGRYRTAIDSAPRTFCRPDEIRIAIVNVSLRVM